MADADGRAGAHSDASHRLARFSRSPARGSAIWRAPHGTSKLAPAPPDETLVAAALRSPDEPPLGIAREARLRRIAAVLVGACCAACEPGGVRLALPCAAPESLAAESLFFDNAIYGIRGTSGGTRLFVTRDSGWQAIVEPIWSDFPGEDDRWPEAPETLAVEWFDVAGARAALRITAPHSDTSSNRRSFGDSLWLTVRCDTTLIVRWLSPGPPDSLRLERRHPGVFPY